MKKRVLILLGTFCFLMLLFHTRSQTRMASIAKNELNEFLTEYHIDSSGFKGPALTPLENGRIKFVWEKDVTDSNKFQFITYVDQLRFSKVVIDWNASADTWNKLSTVGWEHYKKNGWRM